MKSPVFYSVRVGRVTAEVRSADLDAHIEDLMERGATVFDIFIEVDLDGGWL